MPGMETKLHAVMNQTGTYDGFSANYSGAGFSGMRFAFQSLGNDDFDKWVAKVKAGGGSLGRNDYLQLERPSENEPPRGYASIDPGLYNAILNECVEPGKMCLNEMTAIDDKGGLGLAGVNNVLPLEYDKYARRGALGAEASYVRASAIPIIRSERPQLQRPPLRRELPPWRRRLQTAYRCAAPDCRARRSRPSSLADAAAATATSLPTLSPKHRLRLPAIQHLNKSRATCLKITRHS